MHEKEEADKPICERCNSNFSHILVCHSAAGAMKKIKAHFHFCNIENYVKEWWCVGNELVMLILVLQRLDMHLSDI